VPPPSRGATDGGYDLSFCKLAAIPRYLEREGLYLLDIEGGRVDRVPGEAICDVEWRDRRNFFFSIVPAGERHPQLYSGSIDGESHRLSYSTRPESNLVVSPDGQQVAFTREDAMGRSYLFIHTVSTSATREVSRGGVEDFVYDWGRRGILTSRGDASRRRLVIIDSRTLKETIVMRDHDPYVASEFAMSPDGSHIAYTRSSRKHEFAPTKVVVEDLATGNRRTISDRGAEGASSPSWSPDGARLAFQACSPCRIYVAPVDTSTGAWRLRHPISHIDEQSPTFLPGIGRQLPITGENAAVSVAVSIAMIGIGCFLALRGRRS